MISPKGKLNSPSLTKPSAISYTCLYGRAALGEERKAVWPLERGGEKSEHKCSYQSRKMQSVLLGQGMLEKKTNSYHSKSRGSHPTEGRRQEGQLTSFREGI